ncbi:hypothetical protein CVT25_012217 [Psilocybe cyanescens]|uniref:Tyrosine specific protein phosphatases domain-containing protein n=1 Tax=Psilocybe cyanescens TaxID=93625 RepID=A0A409XFL9_PSICY|nr:hypothetical protein CVT25_012217 [Psilocybe cyanescens]
MLTVTPTEQLSRLASQHHASQYNRSKFGQHGLYHYSSPPPTNPFPGSPFPYLPLSIHLPEQFHHLRQRQLLNIHYHSWWPSHSLLPPLATLKDDLMAAMSEPLATSNNPSLKNSVSHPIKLVALRIPAHSLLTISLSISMIIPPDLIALISSQALLSSAPNPPTLLEIPASFTLCRLSSWRDTRYTQSTLATQPPFAVQTTVRHFPTRSHVTHALQAAISSGITKDDRTLPEHIITGYIPQTNVSLSLSMTLPIDEFSRPTFASPTPPTEPTSYYGLSSQHIQADSPLMIGNFFLSSCPGKKVRLDGPIKGRNGVCRDLETDMKRMKELGVRCVICCLDDTELEFLGVPWPEYERGAKKIGIDILRLPIPEGLPPLSPASLDVHLVDLIHRYTLQGFPILAHCRGGVGRAGLIACCWMIRLGLCGSIIPNSPEGSTDNLAQDVLSFVETVISLVRRRRSMKAIETYEQVKFLVEYVEYLCYRLRTPQEIYIPA